MTAAATCPYCAEPIAPTDVKCRACGEAVGKALAERRAGPDPTDPGQVLGWAFQDPRWGAKVLTGGAAMLLGLLSFVLVVGMIPLFAITGYKLRCARAQRERPGDPVMPEWDDWIGLALDGLKLTVALWLLGAVVMLALGVVCGGIAAIDLLLGKPGPFVALAIMIFYFAVLGLSLGMNLVLPAIEMEYLETESVLCAVRFGALWRRMTTRGSDYLVCALVYFLIGMLAGVGVILCYIGLFATIPWAQATQGALVGRYLAQQKIKDAALLAA